MIEKTLKDLLGCKENLKQAQEAFVSEWKKTFPCLWTEDIYKHTREINEEMDYLLSSCLKFKSARLLIPTPGFWFDEVVLTQKPGLKPVHHAQKEVDFIEALEILPNGDVRFLSKCADRSKRILKLSVLKGKHEIRSEKLQTFYSFLQECIDWQKAKRALIATSRYYWDEDDDEGQSAVIRDNYKIRVFGKGFAIKFPKFEQLESFSLTAYPHQYGDQELPDWKGTKPYISGLMKALEHFPQLSEDLFDLERRKETLISTAKRLREELQKYTNGFKILRKLA